MPYEAFILAACKMFHCTPGQLGDEDYGEIALLMRVQNLIDMHHQSRERASGMSREQLELFAQVTEWSNSDDYGN